MGISTQATHTYLTGKEWYVLYPIIKLLYTNLNTNLSNIPHSQMVKQARILFLDAFKPLERGVYKTYKIDLLSNSIENLNGLFAVQYIIVLLSIPRV